MAVAAIRGRVAPLNTPNLRWYWFNAVISAFGDSVTNIALTLMVLLQTGSLSLMAAMSIVVIVPGIVFGILSATWVDRRDARRVIVISQIARALLILGLVYVDVGHHLWIAFVLAACQSLVGTFDDPARARLIQTITDGETRLAVNSIKTSGVMIAGVLGTTAGGGLVGILDMYWPAFVANSAAFLAGALAVSRIRGDFSPVRPTPDIAHEGARFAREVIDGLLAIRNAPTLTAVVFSATAMTSGLGAATIMLTPLIVDVLHMQPAWFGVIEGAQASGAILISLAVGILGMTLDPRWLVTGGLITTGIIIGGLGLANTIWTLLALMFLVGVTMTPVGTGYSTLLQTHAPKAMIGRIAATMNTGIQTASVLSMAVAGLLGDALGVRPMLGVSGAVCFGAGIFARILFRRAANSAIVDPAAHSRT